jgi:hypothetical protein
MSTPVVLLVCAAIFAAFGLVMRRQRRAPGCSSCSSACHRKESRHA